MNPDGFLVEPAGLAALPAAATLRRRGVHAVAELSSTDVPVPPGEDVVAIGISASGATEETVAALERHRGRSRTVAITHDPDGPLAALADVVVPLRGPAHPVPGAGDDLVASLVETSVAEPAAAEWWRRR
ncbi:MAG TPA: SIS domain-containing protein [Solirubrobacteraceae bacterium]|nr:SIS domain-containing protein [Solirubrobacteraceae bacterium]